MMRDRKGRKGCKRGRPRMLTEAQAQEIRDWYAVKKTVLPAKVIAAKMRMSTSNVYMIARGKLYKPVVATHG